MNQPAERFEFSVSEHVVFLAGYLDAVGRVLTTDSELWALTAREAKDVLHADRLLGVPVRGRSAIENWSREFSRLVDGYLRMDQRTRLGFYIDQAVYLLQLDGDQSVVLLIQHIDKAVCRQ